MSRRKGPHKRQTTAPASQLKKLADTLHAEHAAITQEASGVSDDSRLCSVCKMPKWECESIPTLGHTFVPMTAEQAATAAAEDRRYALAHQHAKKSFPEGVCDEDLDLNPDDWLD